MAEPRGDETVELLQTLIRNACVNEGHMDSGQEIRNADVLTTYLEGAGVEVQQYHAAPGRTSLVARIEGTDPDAPSLCLNGHTDVVPISPDGWDEDPFGGEVINNEVWGRGAVDMLNLTASMAVVTRAIARSGTRLKGDLVFFAVADEEAGSVYGARWMGEHHPDVITTDYLLTENGGLHVGSEQDPAITMVVGEKGIAWRRLRVRGTPGHGSRPYRSDNAVVKAAAVVQRIAEYNPSPSFHEYWRPQVDAMGLDPELRAVLLDEGAIDEALATLPASAPAGNWHACTHTTFSPNVVTSQTKTNIIPDVVDIDVDIRTLPGETHEDVEEHLRHALGDIYDQVSVEVILEEPSTQSQIDTPLWDSMQKAVANPFPTSRIAPTISVGFTDARVHRDLGAVAYGAGLLSPALTPAEFGSRFHGHNERIDLESLDLTTRFYHDVVRDLLG